MFNMKLISLTLLAFITSNVALAFPTAPFDALKIVNKEVVNLDPQYDFDGIIKLSNCSGSIIKFAGMPDTAKAIAMTNGHCLSVNGGMIDPNEAIINKTQNRSMKVYNNNQKLVSITATSVLYSTMTKTDITLYELQETYADLNKKGVHSFDLDGNHPALGTQIDIVSGYWDRGYRCAVDAFIYILKEAGYTMNDSIRYSDSGCNTIGGTSGSPIIQTGTRTVIGINNTGNESGKKCTMNNPCEVDANGKIVVKAHASYGQETFQIYNCLTPDFRIDLSKEGCTLQKPSKK
jgi:V8-like Glu-specific endopeptidase